MADISMCDNQDCPLRTMCYRFTATPNPYRQAYADFKYSFTKTGIGCDSFWDNKEYEDEKIQRNKR